jgi:surfactin synthase thioesterase subunit
MSHNRYLPAEIASDAKLRLFALPFAGGGAAGYFRWRSALRPNIEVVPINLPGRDARITERPITNLHAMVTEIADAIEPLSAQPFALLGHSMGGLLAFELARELRRRGAAKPVLLVVAACAAPHRTSSAEVLHTLSDAEFVAEMVRRFDGIPPAVRTNGELLKLLLPAMRADMELLETYEYEDQSPLDTDILVLGGTEDRAVSATALGEWRRHTSQRFSSRLLPGGHFFLFPSDQPSPDPTAAVRVIAERLASYLHP